MVKNNSKLFLITTSLFLFIFLLFNSGFLYKLTGEIMASGALVPLDNDFDYPRYNYKELSCARWINIQNERLEVYADDYRWGLLVSLMGDLAKKLPYDILKTPKNSYLFFGSYNMQTNELVVRPLNQTIVSTTEYTNSTPILLTRNLIYNNGGAQIFH
jgi:uncharacterized membrane protein